MSVSAVTTNFGFRLIDFATDPYVDDEWFNWRLLDGLLTSSQTVTPFVVGTGTGAAYVADYSPDQVLTVGLTLAIKTPIANTGVVTLNVDGQGAKPIKINGTDPSANAFLTGMYLKLVYDGTNFNVVYPSFSVSQGAKVTTASSGATASAGAGDFIVESNASVGMSVLTSLLAGVGRYYMGTVNKPDAGGLYYDFSVDRLYLRAGQTNGPYLDSSKVLRQPQLPLFYYYTNGAITAPTAGNTWKPATSTVDQGPAAPHYSSATGEFTAPLAGVYEFEWGYFANTAGGGATTWTLQFKINGTVAGPLFTYATTSSGYGPTRGPYKVLLSLAAGDKVRFDTISATGDTGSLSALMYLTGKLLP